MSVTNFLITLLFIIIALGIIGGGCAVLPRYNVWQQGLAGQAELARAEQNRQIAVQEAQAKLDAATLLAQVEVERAKGLAKANEIIGESLRNNEAYLRYLYIDQLGQTDNQIIYIPTEAGLPILEAGRIK